ncbi:MAG: 2-nitropropane dioxygenase [Rickettsiales bacterium]|jgi:enoyl-[acyl-carrier protein] reductase II|nr:2-nitropropane dioxygenase [Rickettsiales bacterium]
MSWVSDHHLVSAISNAGGFGVIACGAMTPALLEKEILATQALTQKPFGVNLITMHPDLDKLVDVCRATKVSHVVLAGGLPKGETIVKIREFAHVLCFAPAVAIAKRVVRAGAEAIVIEGMEAGGHIGPVSTSVLVQEILPEMHKDVPIFVAGGIGRGETIASYLKMGASGCQLGTRFVCASESIAHPNFKKAFIRAQARDAVPSVQLDPEFPVIPVRAIQNEGSRKFMQVQMDMIQEFRLGKLSKEEAQLKIEHFWSGALRRAVIEGDVEMGSLMAGQSVGMVKKEEPVAETIRALLEQATGYLARN